MRKWIMVLGLLCFHTVLFSQEVLPPTVNAQGLLPNVIPASPEAASLGKYGEWPVSEYTGVPNINVPVYSIKLKGLEITIQLSYHAGGVKLDEMASWVGTGWSLNAGGAVTRTIVGLADDDPGGIIQQYQQGNFLKGNYDVTDSDDYVFFRKIDAQQLDAEPDIYYYNFAGASGKFCFDSTLAFRAIPVNTIQVTQSPFLGKSGSNAQWIIADDKGNSFYFGSNDPVGSGANGVERTASGVAPIKAESYKTTSWYLTKIITADRADTVYFDYGQKFELYFQPPVITLKNLTNASALPTSSTISDWNSYFHANGFLYNGNNTPGIAMLESATTGGSMLRKIRWRGGEVDFTANTARQDMLIAGANMLDSIKVYNEFGNAVKSFNLKYSYVQNRYFLDSLKQVPLDNTAPLAHAFTYINRNSLPTSASLTGIGSYQEDHWGYFNGSTGSSNTSLLPPSSSMPSAVSYLLVANREPDTVAMQYGTLNKIFYPTGGSTQFDYQSNRYTAASQVVGAAPTGVVISTAQTVTGNTVTPYQNVIAITSGVGQTNATITVNVHNLGVVPPYAQINMGWIPYVMFGTQAAINAGQQIYANAFDNYPAGGVTANSYGLYDFTFTISNVAINGGTYYLVVSDTCFKTTNCVDIPAHMPYIEATVHYLDYAPPPAWGGSPPLPIAGGLRIKQLTNYDVNGNFINRKQYTYAPGNLLMYPTYTHHYQMDIADIIKAAGGQGDGGFIYCSPLEADFLEESSTSRAILGLTQGAPVGYTQVTESDLDLNGNDKGYTNYGFSFFPDSLNLFNFDLSYTPWAGTLIVNPTVPANSFEYKRGLLLSRDIFKRNTDNSYTKLSSLANNYNYNDFNAKNRYARIRGLRLQRLRLATSSGYRCASYYQGYDIPSNYDYITPTGETTFSPDFGYSFYNIITGWVQNVTATETLYDQNGQNPVTKVTNTYYDNPLHMQPTRTVTTRSNQDSIISLINYPQDYAAGTPFIDTMVAHHELSIPIENVSYEVKPGNTTKVLGGSATTYLADGRGLPGLISLVETPGPVALSGFTFSNTGAGLLPYATASRSVFTPDSRYVGKAIFSGYDAYANPIEEYKANDAKHNFIWDYRHSYPVAQVINGSLSDIAYTSFEADGAGNWTVGSAARDTTTGITGTRSYVLNSDISKSGLTSATTYIVSYWTTNHAPFTISGTLSGYPVKGKTITINNSDWTFYTHRVTGQTTVSISGTGHIDELRLYPLGAQMTTYTYQPLVGMTSQTDIGNRITYYEYDGLQRLKRVRDQDYNILKTLEYQYQASTGCGGTCYNVPMQTFAGTTTLGYPVGVFDVHGALLGNATGPASYVTLWNADTANARIGTLSTGTDSLHFSLTLNTGMTLPAAVTGCRYYQVDLTWNRLDGVRNINAAYITFGDGTGMRMGSTPTDTPAIIAPNTTYGTISSGTGPNTYFIHTYPDSSLKTLTFYHNDAAESEDLDNKNNTPLPGLTRLSNLRGNLPQNTPKIGGSCYQIASMTSIAAILNWNTISSVQYFRLNNGDSQNPAKNIGYSQDFMRGNKGLINIYTSLGFYRNGYRDTTFRLSRLKSDWNTYFTNLQAFAINDDHWNREDLTALTHLSFVQIFATTQNHQDDPNSPLVPIPTSVIDNIINQVAAGAGQTVSNGTISIQSGGTSSSAASSTAVNLLKSKGWVISVNGTNL